MHTPDDKPGTAPETDVKSRLIDAGVKLFSRRGYAATSVREIVDCAGVTKPVLYYHFNNKEGLFFAILQRAAQLQDRTISDALMEPGTVLDRVTRLLTGIYKGAAEHLPLSRMIHNLVLGPPQGAPPYDLDRFHRAIREAARRIYMEGIALGEVRDTDPAEASYLIVAILDFCFHMDLAHPEAHDSERPRRLLEMAFSGLAAEKFCREA